MPVFYKVSWVSTSLHSRGGICFDINVERGAGRTQLLRLNCFACSA